MNKISGFFITLLLATNVVNAQVLELEASTEETNVINFPEEIKTIGVSQDAPIVGESLLGNISFMFNLKKDSTRSFVVNVVTINNSVLSYRITPQKNTKGLLFPPKSVNKQLTTVQPHHYHPTDYVRILKSIHRNNYEEAGFSIVPVNKIESIAGLTVVKQSFISDGTMGLLMLRVVNSGEEEKTLDFRDFYSNGVVAVELNVNQFLPKQESTVMIVYRN